MSDKVKLAGIHFGYDYHGYYIPPFEGHCFVGVGWSPAEAAKDCIKAIYLAGHKIEESEIMDECPAYVNEPGYESETYYDGPSWYCAVQLEVDGE
jgi:hypothetical protein